MNKILLAAVVSFNLTAPAIADSLSVVVKERLTGKYHTIEVPAGELNSLRNSDQYLSVEPNRWVSIPTPQQYEIPQTLDANNKSQKQFAQGTRRSIEPNDPEYSGRYEWQSQTLYPGSSEINQAVNKSFKHKRLRIAVIDGGFNEYQDIPWRVEEGHNFFQAFGQTINPQWRSLDDINACETGHGNAVGAIIGATRDNNLGIAGILDADLIPIRAFECNMARLTDIADAIRYAAGEQVDSAPTIAKVDIINISSEAFNGTCPNYLQEAIDLAITKDIQIYASAGNSNTQVSEKCQGVALVAASDQQALKWQDSNFGEVVDFTVAGYDVMSYNFKNNVGWWEGTSFATPNAVGIHGLAKQHTPESTHAEIINIMKKTAQSMSTNISSNAQDCSGNRCGAGLLNASKMMDVVVSNSINSNYLLRHALMQSDSCDQQLFVSHLGNETRLCKLYEVVIDQSGIVSEHNIQIFKVLKGLVFNELNAELISESKQTIALLENIQPSEYDYGVKRCQSEECDQAPIVPISHVEAISPAFCQ